jgi:cell wall assembly regulator SMI1
VAKKPKLKSRKLPPCGPVDVPAVWKRIEAAVGKLAPELVGNLAKGATDKQIAAFEKTIKRKLPEEVRDSFRAHNGQRDEVGYPLFRGVTLGSLEWSQSQWKMWTKIEGDEDLEEQVREMSSSTPKDAIRLGYVNRNWIALISTGGSNYFGLDFNPGPKGLPGQVINFGRDEEHKTVLAWSWGWFLTDLAEELEAGNFRFTPNQDDEDGMVLIQPAPAHDHFYNAHSEWSKAKTAGKRPFDPLAEEELAPLRADTTVKQLAKVIAENRDFGSLPILADALEDAGCTSKSLLAHCRKPGEHGCGCWAVNLLLGKAPEFVAAG